MVKPKPSYNTRNLTYCKVSEPVHKSLLMTPSSGLYIMTTASPSLDAVASSSHGDVDDNDDVGNNSEDEENQPPKISEIVFGSKFVSNQCAKMKGKSNNPGN